MMHWQSTFVGGLVVGFYFNWKLTLVILAFTPLLALTGAMMKVRPSTIQRSSPLTLRVSVVCGDRRDRRDIATVTIVASWRQTAETKHEVSIKNAYSLAATAAGEALSSFKTVTAFGGGKREVKKYASNLVTAQKAATKKGFNLGFVMVLYSC
jgi:ATP-binding cassette subfamily B (MDR/TAP) protein 1